MKYYLNKKQEEKFEQMVEEYKETIKLALFKTNIKPNQQDDFYTYALEGFLQAFLILEEGDISEKDFPAFAFTNMKRKIIDEIRRRARHRYVSLEEGLEEKIFSHREEAIDEFIFTNSINKILNEQEQRIVKQLSQGKKYKDIIKQEKISKSTYYKINQTIKDKCISLLYKS